MRANFITNEIISTFYTESKTMEESNKIFKAILYDVLFNYDKIEEYLSDTYGEDFSTQVFDKLNKSSEIEDVNREIDTFYSFSQQPDRYKYLCSLSESMARSLLPHIPESFGNYYIVLGPEKMRALGYNITDMKNAYNGIIGNQDIDIGKEIKAEFIIGEIYSKAVVKDKLREIYKRVGYDKTPRAIDLGDYFYIKDCMITNKDTGKRDASYKITGIKEDE